MFAHEKTADADFGRVGFDQQGKVGGAGKEMVHDVEVFWRQREPLARVAAKIPDGVCRRRGVWLPLLATVLKIPSVFFRKGVGRPAAIFAWNRLEVIDPHNRRQTRARAADQQSAHLRAALGNRAEASYDLRRQTVDHVQAQVHDHGLAGHFPNVIAGRTLCR